MQKFTHLTTSLDICVETWMMGHGVTVKACFREFVEDWVIVAGNAGNL